MEDRRWGRRTPVVLSLAAVLPLSLKVCWRHLVAHFMLILFPFFRELEICGNCAVLLPGKERERRRRHYGHLKYCPSNAVCAF